VIGIDRTPLSGIGETGDIGARRRQDQRAPPARLEDPPLVAKLQEHLEIRLSALPELVRRRDGRGDDLAVSVYYYFESKEELLWAVWEKGGIELLRRVVDAIAGKTDPWQRMETACIAHTTGLLDWRRANQALFIMPPWHYPESIKARVIALRDEYEKIFIGLIDDLPLRKGVDRRYLRLAVIGALSWSLFWFKKERDTPAAIAKQIVLMLRGGVEDER
jgi:Tetracyclin repressor-like, C-terminal domain